MKTVIYYVSQSLLRVSITAQTRKFKTQPMIALYSAVNHNYDNKQVDRNLPITIHGCETEILTTEGTHTTINWLISVKYQTCSNCIFILLPSNGQPCSQSSLSWRSINSGCKNFGLFRFRFVKPGFH